MDLEVVALLSVAMICGTVAYITTPKVKKTTHESDVRQLWAAVNELVTRIGALEAQGVAVTKLADEAKKMISEAQLAKGLRIQR